MGTWAKNLEGLFLLASGFSISRESLTTSRISLHSPFPNGKDRLKANLLRRIGHLFPFNP
ncbi:hypothetical protein CH371_15705 [Leptospira wolffii]|uniref:Uncharacterized protein n=1 Tax=Leptospira wolffii TaxID=409998 RepID=A0A2M9Z951_9LEPT|nr:hypothetical protein CH371_15705 [Leptospira wolffii]